jgi:glycosyltransferase involved in cell wall biosynthesis
MKTDVSIIVPVKDEEKNILILAEEINAAMKKTNLSWECVWVDDGSTDDSLSQIKSLNQADPRHRWVSLAQNFGQSAAMAAGFANALGRILVTLDGDGQNDPADIPALVNRLISDGADMVNGWRKTREDSFIRKISSKIANGFRNRITRENIRDVGCSLRAFRRECVDRVPVFKGMHRFLPTLIRIAGFDKILEMPVNHRPRKLGKTKYGIHNRLWVGLADTVAVYWMQRRMVFPVIKNKSTREED